MPILYNLGELEKRLEAERKREAEKRDARDDMMMEMMANQQLVMQQMAGHVKQLTYQLNSLISAAPGAAVADAVVDANATKEVVGDGTAGANDFTDIIAGLEGASPKIAGA